MRFLMVDKILELKKGEMATGVKNLSFEECSLPGLGTTGKMPRTLILEGIGQLAAWLIMVTRDFEVRPIIASFGKVEFTGDAGPGDQMVIQVELKSLHDDSALVEGEARVADKTVARASHGVCSFVPVEMFDEPEELKAQYQALVK